MGREGAGVMTFRPFSNGTERMSWEGRNCGGCWKSTPPEKGMEFRCAIESAVVRACDLGDEMPQRILDRLGHQDGDLFLPDCPEREESRPPATTRRGARPPRGQESLL